MKIKNCPNCGCLANKVVKGKYPKYKYRVECFACWNSTKWYWELDEAVAEWNSKDKDEPLLEEC